MSQLVLPQWLSAGRLRRLAATLGPGLVVMLADTDAGSVLTAAQSGAQWGYPPVAAAGCPAWRWPPHGCARYGRTGRFPSWHPAPAGSH
ncbi:hypothetical protein [Aquitalea magnusonii]|uniref:hypothetical protein n=1 Tax=Aquitalea magnusonii TaxID=332411 RepID=UPI00195D8802|nr:hypothetical protein [Aquitalea magnusonii]